MMPEPALAYIHHGRLHLQRGGANEIVECAFGRSLRERAIEIYNRHAWKSQGRGGQSLSHALRAAVERDPADFRIDITSVALGSAQGELVYTLETDEISGVFARAANGVERRLYHTADFRLRHLDMYPDGSELAVSIYQRNGIANLAVLKTNNCELTEVTEGDSVDEGARWIPGGGRRLVYQSAGMGRDARGRFAEHSPFSIQELDLDTGDVSCLAQDESSDLLWPQMTADGSLYYISRPSASGPKPVKPQDVALTTALMPLRILWAIGLAIEMFVFRRTGQPLIVRKNKTAKDIRCPSSWQLIRQTVGQPPEAVARGAMAFDLCSDGSVVYSDGIDVYRVGSRGEEPRKIITGTPLELLAAL